MKVNLELKTKVVEILGDNDTKHWVSTLGSESSQTNYPKHLGEYLIHRKFSINQFIDIFKKDSMSETKKLQEFVNLMLENHTPGVVANYVAAVKNRLEYDGIQLAKRIRIPNRHTHPTVVDETIPTKEQILSFLQNAKPSSQTIIALMAFLGIRFNVIAGLKISDFPELQINSDTMSFQKTPTIVKIRAELSKNKRPYQTFLIEFGCQILKNYLTLRLRNGEQLSSDSLIIPTDSETDSLKRKASTIARRLYTVFDKLGYDSRPYSIKDFFATALLNSGLQQNYQTFFMGHKGPVQNEYSVRRQLPNEQIEIMRNLFKEKIEPHLIPREGNSDLVVKAAFRKLASEMGLHVTEDKTMDETITEIAKLYGAAKEDIASRTTNGKQKRITETELDKYLDEGWELVTTLPSGNLVVKSI